MPPRDRQRQLSQVDIARQKEWEARKKELQGNQGASRQPGTQRTGTQRTCFQPRMKLGQATGTKLSDIQARELLQNRLTRNKRLEPQTFYELLTLPSSAEKGQDVFMTKLTHYIFSPRDEAAKIGKLGGKDWSALKNKILVVVSTSDRRRATEVAEEIYAMEIPSTGPNLSLLSKPQSKKEIVEWLIEFSNFYSATKVAAESGTSCTRDMQVVTGAGRIYIRSQTHDEGLINQFLSTTRTLEWCWSSEIFRGTFTHKQIEYIDGDLLETVASQVANRAARGNPIKPKNVGGWMDELGKSLGIY